VSGLLAVFAFYNAVVVAAGDASDQFFEWPDFALLTLVIPPLFLVRFVLQTRHTPNDLPRELRIEAGRAMALREEEFERVAEEAARESASKKKPRRQP